MTTEIIESILKMSLDERFDIIYSLFDLTYSFNRYDIIRYLYKYIKNYYIDKYKSYDIVYSDKDIFIKQNNINDEYLYYSKYNIFSVNPENFKFISFYFSNDNDFTNEFYNIFIHMCSYRYIYVSFYYENTYDKKRIDKLKSLLPDNIIVFDIPLIM